MRNNPLRIAYSNGFFSAQNNIIVYLLSFRDSASCDPERGSPLPVSLCLSQVILQYCADINEEKILENNVYAWQKL